MLARDWYYNERRQIGLDRAVASIYDVDDDRSHGQDERILVSSYYQSLEFNYRLLKDL